MAGENQREPIAPIRGSEIREGLLVHRDLFDHADGHAQLPILEKFAERVPVDKIDGRRAISCRLTSGIGGEGAGGDDQAFVSATDHGAPEVAHRARARAHRAEVALRVSVFETLAI